MDKLNFPGAQYENLIWAELTDLSDLGNQESRLNSTWKNQDEPDMTLHKS